MAQTAQTHPTKAVIEQVCTKSERVFRDTGFTFITVNVTSHYRTIHTNTHTHSGPVTVSP